MGNQPVSRSYSPSPPPSRTHYTVHCHKHTWINVYDGYDEFWYNHYRTCTDSSCHECAKEKNEREAAYANERAEAAKKKEEERIRLLKAKLESEERARQEKARKDRETERLRQEQIFIAERQKKEKERLKIESEYIRESAQKIETEIKRLKSIKTKNPYIAWKKCDTLKTVKAIGASALQYGVAGQIVCEKVSEIKSELKQTLEKDYKLVKPEFHRYEKYGTEMANMTTAFIEEFGAVFDEMDDTKEEYEVFADDCKTAKENKDIDDEEFCKDEMTKNIESLSTAINRMKLKLLLMDEYFIKIKAEYEFFIDFIQKKSNEYLGQKSSAIAYLKGIADDLKNKKKRDIFEGTDEKQKEFIEEKYDEIRCSLETKKVQIGVKHSVSHSGGGDYAVEGAAAGVEVGCVAGALIGGVLTVPAGGIGVIPGALIGACVGGLLGGLIGCLFKKKTRKHTKKTILWGTETRMTTTMVKNGGSVSVTIDKQFYSGLEHSKALSDIGEALKKPIDDFINELAEKKESAQSQLQKFEFLRGDIQKMIANVNEFKVSVDAMKAILNSPNGIDEKQRKMLDKKWKETSAKVSGVLQSMKKTNDE